ncbi:MAG: hypothetical protein WD673_16195 [Alphaproteobacteria bacterium]
MANRRRGLLSFGLFAALVPSLAMAESWETVTPEMTPVHIEAGWPWLDGARQETVRTWNADNSARYYLASWTAILGLPRVEILFIEIGANKYWKKVDPMNEEFLRIWAFLQDEAISAIKAVSCAAEQCLQFAIPRSTCLAFTDVLGSMGARSELPGANIVRGYHCSGAKADYTGGEIAEILAAIDAPKR